MWNGCFPGMYLFSPDTPDDVFMELKRVPAMSKLLADGNFHFLSLEEEEAEFFRRMLGRNAHCASVLCGN